MKTIRFSQIVATCGAPAIHLTWLPPEKDPTLKAALKHDKVMTLHQTVRGSAKDYGTVGLMKTPNAQILIFPRSLRAFEDRRVIGIDYDLLAAPLRKGAARVSTRARPKPAPGAGDADARPTRNAAADSSDATEGEVVSFGASRRDGVSKRKRAVARDLAKEPKKSAPPNWDDAVEEIALAREELQKRRLGAARERLARLENWIRHSR